MNRFNPYILLPILTILFILPLQCRADERVFETHIIANIYTVEIIPEQNRDHKILFCLEDNSLWEVSPVYQKDFWAEEGKEIDIFEMSENEKEMYGSGGYIFWLLVPLGKNQVLAIPVKRLS